MVNPQPSGVFCDRTAPQSYAPEEVTNRVFLGDARDVLKKLPDELADLVFVDPPYFLQLPKKKLMRWNVRSSVNGVDDPWDKFESFEAHDAFLRELLRELRRVMKPGATIWVIATYHSIFRIGAILQDLGFWILNDVHWVKTNPMPNWLGVRFTNATETLIWAARDREVKRYTFNKDAAREFGIGKVGANVWVVPLCKGPQRLRDSGGEKLHSTQKPVELLRRVLLTSTREGDLVLDPLAGSGTTGFVARALNRRFVLIEINPRYAEGIDRRLSQEPILRPPASKILRKIDQYLKLEDECSPAEPAAEPPGGDEEYHV